jgi:hypothetical protein
MPIYRVKAPDGSILRIDGPPLASDEELAKAAEAHYMATTTPGTEAAQGPSVGDYAQGAAETAGALGTGMTTGAAGMIGGTLKGMAQSLLDGSFGSNEAANLIEQKAMQGAEALTYAPRTEQGQQMTRAAGEVLAQTMPAAGLTAEIGAIAGGLKAAAPVARAVTERAIAPVAEAAKAGTQAIKQAAGLGDAAPATGAPSVGAAGVDLATIRSEKAAGLPVPVELTRGAAGRDATQLALRRSRLKATSAARFATEPKKTTFRRCRTLTS